MMQTRVEDALPGSAPATQWALTTLRGSPLPMLRSIRWGAGSARRSLCRMISIPCVLTDGVQTPTING
ncbi:hypothetical protein, partial [Candidatus Flexifilum breve]|uniref:hypothetical protein n=1 Tax=Candidatus Flexifilum breve TaxID=3140694 RepID=UPI0031CC3CB2